MASRSDILAGKAFVSLYVDNSALVRGLMKAKQRLRSFQRTLNMMGQGFLKAGAAITGPLIATVAHFTMAGDALNKMAIRTGITVESLSKLKFAAQKTGTTIDSLSQAIFRARRRIGNAASDTGPAVRSLKELGLVASELATQTPEDQLFTLVDALQSVGNEARRNQLAFEIFGDNFRDIQPLLNQGSAGIKQLMNEAERLGLVVSSKSATAASNFSDALMSLKEQLATVAFELGGSLVGSLTSFVDAARPVIASITEWVKANGEVVRTAAAIGGILLGVGAATVALGGAFSVASFVVGGLATAISTVGTIVGAVFSPVGLVVAGVAAYVGALSIAFWKLANPLSALMPLATAVMNSFRGIAGALLQGDFAGAFEVMASSIRTVMFAATRGAIDIVRNMLANILGLVTGTSDSMTGALSSFSNGASRIFNEVWQAGKVAFTALASFVGDVFSQAPQLVGYAFGLAVKTVAESVAKLQNWMAQSFAGFVTTLVTSFTNLGPSLIKAMLTGDVSGIADQFGAALRKSMAAQTLAMSGLAAGLFGGEMPEFKMSPETIAAYEKMAAVTEASGATPSKERPTGSTHQDEVSHEKPTLPESDLAKYKARVAELSEAFATSTINADELASGIAELKRETVGIDSTPVELFDTRLELLNQALADGTITQREWKSAVSDARAEIFSLSASPLDDFRSRAMTLGQALASGAIGMEDYRDELAKAKREILGIEPDNLRQFADRINELREQFEAGAISKGEFDKAFQSSQQNFLGIDTDPIDRFKTKLIELKKALGSGLITKDQFKTAAMDALPDRVKQIIDETRTPVEKFRAEMAELNKLKAAGLINDETYSRRQKQLKSKAANTNSTSEGMASDQKTTFGTFSASALIDSGRGATGGPQERMTKTLEEQRDLIRSLHQTAKEQRALLYQMSKGLTAR